MRLFKRILVSVGLCAGIAFSQSDAQERTGTRVDSRAARPAVLHINRTSELDRIRSLIQDGDHRAAVALAQAHVERARDMLSLDDERASATHLYDALNALCIALMTADRTDEALETCTEAISSVPRRWSAWNSRGTTHFARENYEAAFNDFARAFELAPDDPEIVDTIERNIRLARDRIAAYR